VKNKSQRERVSQRDRIKQDRGKILKKGKDRQRRKRVRERERERRKQRNSEFVE
jgi:hypothetical protein